MKYSEYLNHWLIVPNEKIAKKKILTDSDWNKRTIEDVKRLEALKIQPDDIVLDFGCGIGRLMKEVQPLCKQVYGVDVSASMLSYAVKYLGGIHDQNMFLAPMKSETDIPVHDGQIDKIYSILVLQHIERPKMIKILKEFNRILRPKGRIFIQLPSIKNESFYFKCMNNRVMLDGMGSLVEFYSKEEVEMIFKHVGLNIIKMDFDGKDYYILGVKK